MLANRRNMLAALLFALGACVHKPTMTLDHAEITGVRIALPPSVSVMMTVYLNVYNPNSYDVAVRAVRGQVLLAYQHTLPVDFRPGGEGVWLAAGSTSVLAVTLVIPAEVGLALLRETLTTPTISYHFVGRADVTATRALKLEEDDYSVNESGFVSREQLERSVRIGM